MIGRTMWTAAAVLVLCFSLSSPGVVPVSAHRSAGAQAGFPNAGAGLPGTPPNDHLQHVITVMMENHDYDSYFGTYCQTRSAYCSTTGNGIPAGTCVPNDPNNLSAGCIQPFNLTPNYFTISDMEHDWWSGGVAMNGGAMNGFFQAEGTGLSMGHYNQSTIPIYWDMAEEYASADNFWGANLSYSLPNHWYLVAGQTPPRAYNNYVGFNGLDPTYLDQSNNTTSVEDLLAHSSASWKYYDNGLGAYSKAITGTGIFGTAYDYWNPMAARHESYTSNFTTHFVPRSSFLTDLQSGGLPNISWVIPAPADSDHPGFNNSYGETWVAQLVDAVENSTYWNSTAIFLSWDDYGGWYDGVAPPSILGHLLSFRAPLLVISPYAKENYISHVFGDFFGLLRFVEWQFGLGCIGPLDCLAPLPLNFFDFNQAPRPPILFGTDWSSTTYPMPLQAGLPLGMACGTCGSVPENAWAGSYTTPAYGLDPS